MQSVSARSVSTVLEELPFIRSRQVILVVNGTELPGFKPPPLDMDKLDGDDGVGYVMRHYPYKVRVRWADNNWKVRFRTWLMLETASQACHVERISVTDAGEEGAATHAARTDVQAGDPEPLADALRRPKQPADWLHYA